VIRSVQSRIRKQTVELKSLTMKKGGLQELGKCFKVGEYYWQSRFGDLLFVKYDIKAAYCKIPELETTACSRD